MIRSYIPKRMIFLLMLLTVWLILPTSAQRPELNVIALWTPIEQLTSRPDLSDTRTVDLQLYVQGNVQFWAANINCTIGRSELSNATLTWGPDWGVDGTDFTSFPTANFFDEATATFEATATRLGADNAPLGVNGQNYVQLLLTLTFEVNDLDRDTSVSVRCRTLDFLNRNGETVQRGRLSRSDRLELLIGYTIEGSVLHQGSRDHENITVTCTHDPSGSATAYNTLTDRRGEYTFGGAKDKATALRDQGLYECEFDSPFATFLSSTLFLNLDTPNYFLLPVTLRAGDFVSDDIIDLVNDVVTVTGNWGSSVPDFTLGDANGDGDVDEADLAIVSANVDWSATTPADHILYSLARDYQSPFPNSKVWWGDILAGPTTALDSRSRTRDFWGMMSPDGTEVVQTSIDSRTGQHHLYIADTERGSARQFTPRRDFDWESLAPSWSPNGERIAFICSWQDAVSGYEYNEGNICVMNRDDTTGNSLTVIIPSGQMQTEAKIFPPTWYDDNTLIYAGLSNHTLCPDQLCFYDFAGTTPHGVISQTEVTGDDVADMPSVINHYGGTTYLFYRFYDDSGDTYDLRAGDVMYNRVTAVWSGSVTGALGASHVTISNTTGVDYYDVSHLLDVMFYEFGDDDFQTMLNTGGLAWNAPILHYVDSYAGSPITVIGGFGAIWNGDLNQPTELHAHRATIDWIP